MRDDEEPSTLEEVGGEAYDVTDSGKKDADIKLTDEGDQDDDDWEPAKARSESASQDDDDFDDVVVVEENKPSKVPNKPAPRTTSKPKAKAGKSKAKQALTPENDPLLQFKPEDLSEEVDALVQRWQRGEEVAVPLCLSDRAFVITGNPVRLSRDDMESLIREFGGKLTGSVSSKTTYLVVGATSSVSDVTQTRKYQRAEELGTPMLSEDQVLGMLVMSHRISGKPPAPAVAGGARSGTTPPSPEKKPSLATAAPSATEKRPASRQKKAAGGGDFSLWPDKHRPTRVSQLIGHGAPVRRLQTWLEAWERVHLKGEKAPQVGRGRGADNSNAKAALISGPPGIGKTTSAKLVAEHLGFDVLEMNASDTRSKKSLKEALAPVTDVQVLSWGRQTVGPVTGMWKESTGGSSAGRVRRCIIMDEVDGLGAQDRGGNAELIDIMKKTRTPIICICNDRQKQSVRSLANHCLDLRFARPNKETIAKRMEEIARSEGLDVEPNAMRMLVESVGSDIRACESFVDSWLESEREEKDGPSGVGNHVCNIQVEKDAILRQTGFTAAPQLFMTTDKSFRERYEHFFVDYDLMPLLIHQNYVSALKSNPKERIDSKLNRMAMAAETLVDADVIGRSLRNRQAWYLLPTVAAMHVKAGWHATGYVPMAEFPDWMGQNSRATKRRRLLGELAMHMNARVSGGQESIRLDYLPVIRDTLYRRFQAGEIDEVLEEVDSYGLSREDFLETLPEMRLMGTDDPLKGIPSKVRSQFTRKYNKMAHRSQALVAEQGLKQGAKKGKAKGAKEGKTPGPDGLGDEEGEGGNGDEGNDDDDDGDDEEEVDMSAFQSKAKGKKGKKGKK